MRKYLIIFLSILNSSLLFSQELIIFPPKLELTKFLYDIKPEIAGDIRIFGVSEDGKIAYSYERQFNEWENVVEFVLYDMANSSYVSDMAWDNSSINKYKGTLDDIEEMKGIIEWYNKYGIIYTELCINNFPLILNDIKYDCLLEYGEANNNGAENYSVKITKDGASIISEERRNIHYESAEICGYLTTPFPNRYIAVILEMRDGKNAFYRFFEFDLNE
ncbi:MAG: hypothetical protein LBK13_04890 [Spirochaetales bacterium]|jgi:hypothetical protein|nr:hypothetical protein [Spirochaetales bacterium]